MSGEPPLLLNSREQSSLLISDAFALICFVFGYSLVVSNIFGHPSFWRQHYFTRNDFTNRCSITAVERTAVEHKCCRRRLLNFLDIHILLELLYYLSPSDLLCVSRLSRAYSKAVNEQALWINLGKSWFNSEPRLRPDEINSKVRFFNQLRWYPISVATAREGLNLVINGAVYDLSTFVIEHPGGEEILREWNNRDASKAFSLALHSRVALKSAKKYLIWPEVG
jgi:Cytochrome b5-like Heme/Steroid binding domain